MAARTLLMVAVAATLALTACDDRQPESTMGPQFAPPANTDPCAISNSLVTGYFPSSHHSTMLSLKQSMANAGQGTPNARTFGFEIMDSIGSVSRSFTVSPTAGAQLTLALIPCMFTNAASFTYPHQNNPALDFSQALTNAAGGAYYVRGGGTGGLDAPGRSATVLGRLNPPGDANGNLSGIAPSSGSWTSMLDDNDPDNASSEGRALIYGYQVSANPLSYEWATIPSGLTFSPEAVVSVCDNDLSATAMVLAEAVGVLAYSATSICNTPQSLTTIQSGWGPKALAARLGQMLVGAVTPAALQATALATAGSGGTTSKIPKSIVSKLGVSTVALSWVNKPPAVIQGTHPGTTFAVSFTGSASGNAVFGACAYLAGTNNNGIPTKLVGPKDPACTNPPNGDPDALSVQVQEHTLAASLADFGQVGVTKNGGINFLGTFDVLNRDGLGSINTKSNVKPAK